MPRGFKINPAQPRVAWAKHHPLGYGRERFFWSLIAAVGIFVGGFGAAVAETLQTAFHPQPTGSYVVGYCVLAVVITLDAVALHAGLRPLRQRAANRRLPLGTFLWRGTDPAVTTLVLSSAAGLTGGITAAAGLALLELTGRPVTDVISSALIGLILLGTSLVLLRTNRELLTGRGLPPAQITQMRGMVNDLPGVLAVPDLFAVVVGPSSVIVDADVVFEDSLDVPQVEAIIVDAATAMRAKWPTITFVYLNPVAQHRPRRGTSPYAQPSRPSANGSHEPSDRHPIGSAAVSPAVGFFTQSNFRRPARSQVDLRGRMSLHPHRRNSMP